MLSRITFKTWICIIVALFFLPFIGIGINSLTGLDIGNLYTFGIADRKDFFTVWIALFGAIGIAFNIHQNHLRTTNQDKQLIKQTEQIELQSQSQRDSRFSKGVELLGNANESARTGAAYSLFFLAKDYPEEFAKPVFEILCSHVRSITNTEEYKEKNSKHPSNEIQSILDLLFRDDQSKIIFDGLKANLAYSCLIGADLSDANLVEADLFETVLSKAYLYKVNLSKADASRADLSKINARQSNLSETDLSGTNLSGSDLVEANLSQANLFHADLSKTLIYNTRFSEKTILYGVDMTQINIANIQGIISSEYLPTTENETNADSQ